MSVQFWLNWRRILRNTLVVLIALVLSSAVAAVPASAQQQQQQSGQNQAGEPPKQQAPTEAGGPEGDIGPYAIPKKPEEKTPPPPPRETPKPIEGMPSYSVTVDVPLVNLDVLALTKDGQFIPKLSKEHFRVLEDGVPQKLQTFSRTEAPLTAVMLIEFANTPYYQLLYDALNASYSFADSLKKDDYVAVIEYDMKTNIIQDFTQDKNAVYGALHQLRIPGFSESNLFDALYDTLDRVDRIEGRKEIILIGTGLDTFSKINFDKIMKKVKETPNVTIFCISTGFIIKNYLDTYAGRNFGAQLQSMDFQMANNHLRTFAKMTGGQAWEPRFSTELPSIFREVGANVRNQYSLTYKPSNTKQDGSYRKLKVELVAPGTDTPLIIKDEKGKALKYQLVYRDGYTAKHQVE